MSFLLQTASSWSRPLVLVLLGTALANGCSKSEPTAAANAQKASATAPAPLPTDDQMRDMLDRVIEYNANRFLDSEKHGAWQIMHGVVAYRRDLQIYHHGELVNGVDWLLEGGQIRGWDFKAGDRGLDALIGTGGERAGQGHEDQWLAILAQAGVGIDEPIVVRGQTYKIRDLVSQAQWDIYDGMESCWTLIALMHYLPLDAQWTARDGGEWSFERIIGMEAKQDINESACGGTHRLCYMQMAINNYAEQGKPLSGAWETAQKKIDEHIALAKAYQQPDGSLSSSYFQRASSSPDIAVRISTTGHTLEFLAFALTDDQLKEDWVVRATEHLCKLLQRTRDMEVECGALYHAINGLQLYRYRRFGPRAYGEPSTEQGDSQQTAQHESGEPVLAAEKTP